METITVKTETTTVEPKETPLWRLALRDFIFVAFDIAMVALSFHLGWGMTVKNWAWFIGIGVFGRYASALGMRVWFMRQANKANS
jgi:hypothetical protein